MDHSIRPLRTWPDRRPRRRRGASALAVSDHQAMLDWQETTHGLASHTPIRRRPLHGTAP